MQRYKVLLVDDEEDVRRSIVRKLDWDTLGFQVVGEAGNGLEAMELAEQLQPDIVMTDIKMPFMDGLELCRQVKRLLPGVRLAIFSGFDEFEYAKEAITRQVEEYILKPIDAQELAAVFQRLRTSLDTEIAERRDVERLRHHYEQSLPLLRQQLLSELLEGRLESGDIVGRLGEYGLDIVSSAYCAAVIRYRQGGDEYPAESRLAGTSLCRLIEDRLRGEARFHLVQRLDQIALIFLMEGSGLEPITELLAQLFPISHRLLGIQLSIGIGRIYARPDEIALSFREAYSALEYRLLVEPGQCIYIGDIEPGTIGAEQPDASYAEELLCCIKVGAEQDLRAAVDALVNHLHEKQAGIHHNQIYLLELFTELLKLIRVYRMDPAEARQDSLLLQGLSPQFANLSEFGEWLAGFCENLRLIARRERRDSVTLLIERTREYLASHYAESELSLEILSETLGVSAAYLSTIFKKEIGQGFVSYLTDLRMEKALELLSTTDWKTYQIAEAIGYGDPNYFSYVFKRKFGTPPTKYRTDRMSVT